MAIRVNMLVLRLTTDAHPRWKNGQPHHRATGVESANSTQGHAPPDKVGRVPKPDDLTAIASMAMTKSGTVSAKLIQNRRVMSSSSGLSSSAVTVRGSSAMPQIGQCPGSARTTSGCIGQVYSVLLARIAGDSGSRAIPHFGHAPGPDCRTSGHIGQT